MRIVNEGVLPHSSIHLLWPLLRKPHPWEMLQRNCKFTEQITDIAKWEKGKKKKEEQNT